MKRILLILIILFLTACGSNDNNMSVSNDPKDSDETTDDVVVEEESEPLPFNVDDVMNDYNNLLLGESDVKVNADDHKIFMVDGSLAEAIILLNALNIHYGDGEVSDLATELASELDNSDSFIGDFVVDDITIHIAAVDASFIGVNITRK